MTLEQVINSLDEEMLDEGIFKDLGRNYSEKFNRYLEKKSGDILNKAKYDTEKKMRHAVNASDDLQSLADQRRMKLNRRKEDENAKEDYEFQKRFRNYAYKKDNAELDKEIDSQKAEIARRASEAKNKALGVAKKVGDSAKMAGKAAGVVGKAVWDDPQLNRISDSLSKKLAKHLEKHDQDRKIKKTMKELRRDGTLVWDRPEKNYGEPEMVYRRRED